MSDIFISYAREDHEWVRVFAQALVARGWSTWWDRDVRTGKEFDDVIAENLAAHADRRALVRRVTYFLALAQSNPA